MTTELTDDQIRDVFLANGFTIKDGQTDLKPYVYAAARALLALQANRDEVMANGLTEAETSASASVAGLTLRAPDGWSIERLGNGDVITSVSPDGVCWYVLKGGDINERREKIGAHFYQLLSDMLDARARDANAASADGVKAHDSIAAGCHRSTASAIDPGKMRGPCGMATSQHAGRRRITLEFDMPEDAVDAHSALIGMGWPQRSIKSAQDGGEVLACLREIVEDCDVEFSDEQWRRYRATISKALGVPSRCPLCGYQHGHATGCENNPVDIALKARASKRGGS